MTALYYHKTDGGAEYLFDTFIDCDGHKEGTINPNTHHVIRLDGDPELTCTLERNTPERSNAMREITTFSSNGVGAPITTKHEPEKQIRRTIKAARELLNSNGLWPPEPRHLEDSVTCWLFDLKKAVRLQQEIDRLKSLL